MSVVGVLECSGSGKGTRFEMGMVWKREVKEGCTYYLLRHIYIDTQNTYILLCYCLRKLDNIRDHFDIWPYLKEYIDT